MYDGRNDGMFAKRIKSLQITKYKLFWIIAIITALASMICIVNIIAPNTQYYFENSYSFEEKAAVEEQVVYEGIALKPGVYLVELEYETDTDVVGHAIMKDGTVFHGGLLTNGEHLYSELGKTSYHMWLFEGTEAMQAAVSYNGEGSLTVSNLTITETNQLWTMFLTGILFVTAVFYVCYIYYFYQKKYPLPTDKRTVFFCVMLISFVASLPYLMGLSISGADLTYHLHRIEGVRDGWLSGQFPVRLEPEWVYGHGYANAIFYCNALLSFPALLRLLGFTVTTSYNIYCIGLNLATAWISYYCFSRIFKSYKTGIALSALYTLSIFRIYKLVITSAVGEGSAVTFMPLVLYGLYRIFTEDPKDKKYNTAWLPVTIGYAGLMQTHVLSCEITAFLTIVICLVCIRKVFKKETFVELAKGALGAIGLSLWYLVPFLDYYITQDVHIKHVSARTIQDRGLYIGQLAYHFWKLTGVGMGDAEGMQWCHPVGIGLVLILALGVFVILWFSGRMTNQGRKNPIITLGKASALLGTLLLLMSLDIFPWDKIQFINSITASLVSSLQFPNRFLGWGTVFLVAVFGVCLWYFEKQGMKWQWYAGMLVMVLGVSTSSMYLLDFVNRDHDRYRLYHEEGMGMGYISGAEYLIEETRQELLTYRTYEPEDGVNVSSYEKDYLHITMTCRNDNTKEAGILLPLLYYKGYRAYDVTTRQELIATAGYNHFARVILPAGYEGTVEVKFASPVYWRISEAVTVLSWIIILYAVRRRRKIYEVEKQ